MSTSVEEGQAKACTTNGERSGAQGTARPTTGEIDFSKGKHGYREYTFKHHGRRYGLRKLEGATKDGCYYVRFEHGGKQHKKSLGTNVAKVAESRARRFIDAVLGARWGEVEGMKLKRPASSVAEVCAVYRKRAQGMLGEVTIRNNCWALLKVLAQSGGEGARQKDGVRKMGNGVEDEDEGRGRLGRESLAVLDKGTVARFQEGMVHRYLAEVRRRATECAPYLVDEGVLREARERALRSSRSMVNQARSLFGGEWLEVYAQEGLKIPAGVTEFMGSKLRGSLAPSSYHAPSDAVIAEVFRDVEGFRESDPNVYKAFWLAVGAGLRRGEIRRCQWEMIIERTASAGHTVTWVSGGIGKDGKRIEVWMQERAVDALRGVATAAEEGSDHEDEGRGRGRRRSGPVIDEGGLDWARRLNAWMKSKGWSTEKKLHDLRAYIGSKIYEQSPRAAMEFMRHKKLTTTETFYGHHRKAAAPVHVL